MAVVKSFQEQWLAAAAPALDPASKHGAFVDTCTSCHCIGMWTDSFNISGVSRPQALKAWLLEGKSVKMVATPLPYTPPFVQQPPPPQPKLTALFTSAVAAGAKTGNPWVKPGTAVTYRIPALVTTNSTVIAFASERLANGGDESATNLVQRSSTDAGNTFGKLTLVVKSTDGMSSAPWAIADPSSSLVYLFWNINSTSDQKCSCGVAVISGKNGASYSAPAMIPASSGVLGSSLDSGIVLQKGVHAGRLLVCMRKICKNSCKAPYSSYAAYSDDKGATWKSSPHLHDGTTECQVAELSDGTVYMSTRPYVGLSNPTKRRFSARSSDGGASWHDLKPEPQLVDAGGVCGSVVSDPSGVLAPKKTVYYSHPDAAGRTNMTLYVSADDAATWTESVRVYIGGSGYSSAALLGGGKVGILFEKDDYKSMALAIVDKSMTLAIVGDNEARTLKTDDVAPTMVARPMVCTLYGLCELTFTTKGVVPPSRPDAFELGVQFHSASGRTIPVCGFFDGWEPRSSLTGNVHGVWYARLMPEVVGRWTWSSHCTEQPSSGPCPPKLHGQNGSFVVGKAAAGVHGRIKPTGTKLLHSDGTPAYITGTTVYGLAGLHDNITDLTIEYMRRAGFNKVRRAKEKRTCDRS